jgi:hypothetical protein
VQVVSPDSAWRPRSSTTLAAVGDRRTFLGGEVAHVDGRHSRPDDPGARAFTLYRVNPPGRRRQALTVELVQASVHDKAVLRLLVQLYHYDFSEWNGDDVDEHGEFTHLYLDHYWTDPGSRPFLIRAADQWAGFALVRTGAVHDMSEFFIMRKFRRAAVGREAARLLFHAGPSRSGGRRR